MKRLWIATAVAFAACKPAPVPDRAPTQRLNPRVITASPTLEAARLVDRDSTSLIPVTGPTTVHLAFGHEVEIRSFKVFGAGVRAEVEGASIDAAAGRWVSASLAQPKNTSGIDVHLLPTGQGGGIAEIEVWGAGKSSAPRDPKLLAEATREDLELKVENVAIARGVPQSLTLHPVGLAEGPECGTVSFASAISPRSAARAYLAYQSNGVLRPVALRRAVNDALPRDGFWIAPTKTARTIVDELDPETLTGRDAVTLCVPAAATEAVTLDELRLVLELDDGWNILDRDAAARLASAWDGDLATSSMFDAGRLELLSSRPVALDGASLDVAAHDAAASSFGFLQAGSWTGLGAVALPAGHVDLPLAGNVAEGVQLTLESPRPDVPAASLAEVSLAGSGVGPRVALPRIVVSYPRLRYQGDRAIGERFGPSAFVAGWAESPSGPGAVVIEGARVSRADGSFGVPLSQTGPAGASWNVTLQATFPDGTSLSRVIHLDDDHSGELAGAGDEGDAATDQRYGRENETAYGVIDPKKGGKVQLGTNGASVDAPPGAVSQATTVGITRKGLETIPPLDPGMINVTAPAHAAYRFTPHGQRFALAVKVSLPYDARLLPDGLPAEAIHTYFYDEDEEHWTPLSRSQVLRASGHIVSETTHFTFMINAVLVTPEHPGPTSFNPTSIKDLKAADPAAGVDLIEPPQPNNQGTARVTFPIRLPRARGAYQPSLGLVYDSSAGNGWVGVGWDLPVSSIAIDTRWGVPYYDGSERYLLDGEQMVPVTGVLGGLCEDSSSGREYMARAERAFRRIRRCGSGPTSYHWEVTDKGGTLFVYGASADGRLASPDTANIGEWRLERVIDTNGNLTEFIYDPDFRGAENTAFDNPARTGEPFAQLYLRYVRYTGHASREGAGALSGGSPGPYLIEVVREAGASGLLERPDVASSARLGFKVLTRHRLGRIDERVTVSGGVQDIRSIVLRYDSGDFGKSRLAGIQTLGVDGDLLHEHALWYTSKAADPLFAAPTPWGIDPGATDAELSATASAEQSVGASLYVGVGTSPLKSTGSVGLRAATSFRQGRTQTALVDINGDGLPDRVSANQVLFNNASVSSPTSSQSFSKLAPEGDPNAGQAVGLTAPLGLGADTGASLSLALQAFAPFVSGSVGGTGYLSIANELLLDADGDGLVDLVTPGHLFQNQTRGVGQPCAASDFCFVENAVPANLSQLGSRMRGSPMADVAGTGAQSSRALHPEDAVLEWTAPFEGAVHVQGLFFWAHGVSQDPARDGVQLRVHGPNIDMTFDKGPTDISNTAVDFTAPVSPGDRIYFVLTTLGNFPRTTPLEEVRFAPTITYTSCSGASGSCGSSSDLALHDLGADVFVFDAEKDFRLAGDPLNALIVPRDGTLEISSTLTKDGMADDIRVCIQHFHANTQTGAFPTPRSARCGSTNGGLSEPWAKGYDAATNYGDSPGATLSVHAGDALVFRIETDLPVNPAAVSWRINGAMSQVCVNGSCGTPSPAEAAKLTFIADPYFPQHGRVDRSFTSLTRPDPVPPRPYVATDSGTLHVQSTGFAIGGDDVFFTARTRGALLFKHKNATAGNFDIPVVRGDQIYFEAHSESYFAPQWLLAAELEVNGSIVSVFSPPRIESCDHLDPSVLSGLLADLAGIGIDDLGRSPFGGGFHGWRYGVWTGGPGDNFDPALFDPYQSLTKLGLPASFSERDLLSAFEVTTSKISQAARLFQPLAPRHAGTRLSADRPGLSPDQPAFVSGDGAVFMRPGHMHAARTDVGGAAELNLIDTLSVAGGLTVSGGGSVGIPFLTVGLNVSAGASQQKIDLLDMNGDRIVDAVVASDLPATNGDNRLMDFIAPAVAATGALAGEVRLTDPGTLGTRGQFAFAGFGRLNTEVSANLSLGVSEPVSTLLPNTKVAAVASHLPSAGGGVGVNMSAAREELIDMNGDGLPDRVTRDANDFIVYMNLGTGFARNADRIPIGAWSTPGIDLLATSIRGQIPNTGDPEFDAKINDVNQAVDLLVGPDVLRRSTTVTWQANLGVAAPDESFGFGADWQTSIAGTQVMLIDVTGDGLPDYVRKLNSDDSFIVRVNLGTGFSPVEERWKAPAWGVPLPNFHSQLPSAGSLPATVAAQDLLAEALGRFGTDTLSATTTYSTSPSIGLTFTVATPIGPGEPWLQINPGADFSTQTIIGSELTLADIDGDGFVDHVLKTSLPNGQPPAIYARLNQKAGGNLLRRVERPLGGSMDLTYARAGNTVDMPESRFVLATVSVHDGFGSGTGHDFTTTYAYAGGRFDRHEREFLGFAEVDQSNPDGLTAVVRTYLNDSVFVKGLLATEVLDALGACHRDPGGVIICDPAAALDRTTNTYGAPEDVTVGQTDCLSAMPFFLQGTPGTDPAGFCTPRFAKLLSTEQAHSEGAAGDPRQAAIVRTNMLAYDAYGNVTQYEDVVAGDTNGNYVGIIEYAHDSRAQQLYFVDHPTHVAIARSFGIGGGLHDILRDRTGTYDSLGNLTHLSSRIDNSTSSDVDLTWDGDGNLATFTDAPNAAGQRYSALYSYDPDARTFVAGISDSHGLSSSAVYDARFGEATRTTDVAGNVTTRALDEFGRITEVRGPQDQDATRPATIAMGYSLPSSSSNPVRCVPTTLACARTKNLLPLASGVANTLDTWTFADGLRRVIQTKKSAEVGGQVGYSVSGHVLYDSMGRVIRQGQVFFDRGTASDYVAAACPDLSNEHPTRFELDPRGRPLRTVEPNTGTAPDCPGLTGGPTTTMEYFVAGTPPAFYRTRIQDAQGKERNIHRDREQRIVAVEEVAGGTSLLTQYEYTPLGDLTKITDANGNVTSMTYDLLGRRTSLANPDSGLTTFGFDAAGNLVEKVDANLRAKGQAIRYAYDFNRLLKVDHPFSTDITFAYGASGAPENGAGRIVSIADEAGTETRGYGKLGELTRSTRTLVALTPGGSSQIFETDFTFDSFGRVLSMNYPDGERLDYAYDHGGLLVSAVGHRPATATAVAETETYIRKIAYDEFGQRVHLELGNGTSSNYTYEPDTRRLSTLTTVTSSPRTLQALTYSYDLVGNVLGVVNGLGTPTGKHSGTVQYAFGYDDLHRLTSASGVALARPDTTDKFTATFTYDGIHNMTRNTQVHEIDTLGPPLVTDFPAQSNHDFAYVYGNAGHPHQATLIGTRGLTYDLNGNTTGECKGTCSFTNQPVRALHWTEENWLAAVVDGNGKGSPRSLTTTSFLYDGAGQRVVKQNPDTGNSITIGQFFALTGGHAGTKHVFAGESRVATKLISTTMKSGGPPGGTPGNGGGGSGNQGNGNGGGPQNDNGCVPSNYNPKKCPTVPGAAPTLGGGPGGGGPPTFVAGTFYYHPDHLGSTSWMTDQAGKVREHVEYYPYGEIWRDVRNDLDGNKPTTQEFLFTGKELDPETGLYYFGARYYDPRSARWMSVDPEMGRFVVQRPGVLSAYRYAGNNPLRYLDPNGGFDVDWQEVGGFSYGLVEGVVPILPYAPYMQPAETPSFQRGRGEGLVSAGIGLGLAGAETAVGGGGALLGAPAEGEFALAGVPVGGLAVGAGVAEIGLGGLAMWKGLNILSKAQSDPPNSKAPETGTKPGESKAKAPSVSSPPIPELTKDVLSRSRVIAKGSGIREAERLTQQYGGRPRDWTKKSTAPLEIGGRPAEVHWYERGGQRFEPKIKYLDE